MESLEGSCSSLVDMTSLGLPQQFTRPMNKDQTEFDPDRGDFVEPSIPTESACSDVPLTFTDLSGEFQQPPSSLCPPTQLVASPSSSVTRDILNQQTQQLIDDINAKRKQDTTLLADFKKAMELQASNSCDSLEHAMYQMYEGNGKVIQEKLQELFATLDRISKLETELDSFKHSLRALYSDIQGSASRPT